MSEEESKEDAIDFSSGQTGDGGFKRPVKWPSVAKGKTLNLSAGIKKKKKRTKEPAIMRKGKKRA